ncbi:MULTISPECIES: transferrin-binding protein-like solute binding protein [unclassified Acinetobacter]|uniref:transferrin-binding protein-like solute binding protein n=1 Tax=unclassified Acinetobacter TaxID=196816 RepID=UPI0035B8DB08
MKTLAISALTLATALLTACGGGSSTTSSTTTVTQPPLAPPSTAPANTSIQGRSVTVDATSFAPTSSGTTAATSNINTVVLNGKSIDIIPTGFTIGSRLDLNAGNMNRQVINNLSNARWGFVREGDRSQPSYFVAQGNVTPVSQIPGSGTVTYTGSALHQAKGAALADGDATLSVNFGNKTLTGNISAGTSTVALNANITGNSFAGTSSAGTTTNGYFYGSNAAEAAGTYINSGAGYSGAFGVKK